MHAQQASVTLALRTLLPLVPKSEKRRFWGLLALAVLAALTELLLTGLVALLAATFGSPEAVLNNNPLLWVRQNLGIGFGEDPRYLALAILIAVLLAIVVRNGVSITQQWHQARFSESVGAAARSHIFRFYQRAPYLWLLHNGVAELNFGLNAAVHLAGTLGITLQIFTSVLMLATLFIGLVSVSPLPSLMFLLVLGLGGTLIVKGTRKLLDRYSGAVYQADYRINKITHLALHGLKEIRLYGRENSLFAAYAEHLGRGIAAKIRQQTAVRLPVGGLEILGFCTLVGVMLFLVFVQDAGMARISGIMGFMAAAAWRGLPVANRLVDAVSGMRGGLPYLRKVAELVALERKLTVELLPLDVTQKAMPFASNIVLEDVSFRYPGAMESAVRHVSMTVAKGKMVGLVGLSGAGKSTLVNLLTGLMPPESGRILVDGVALTRGNACSWLRRIGYVAQAPYILDASLAENVALSRWGEPLDRDRVRECCRMAALDFVDDLEYGMDTILGDRGTRLSGGQAQRVAIARALYSEPDLIIFDEATSALDMKNEKAIHDTILSLRSQVTMVIIAHRLTTVEGCDSIIWLEKGRVHKAGGTAAVLPEYQAALRSGEI